MSEIRHAWNQLAQDIRETSTFLDFKLWQIIDTVSHRLPLPDRWQDRICDRYDAMLIGAGRVNDLCLYRTR